MILFQVLLDRIIPNESSTDHWTSKGLTPLTPEVLTKRLVSERKLSADYANYIARHSRNQSILKGCKSIAVGKRFARSPRNSMVIFCRPCKGQTRLFSDPVRVREIFFRPRGLRPDDGTRPRLLTFVLSGLKDLARKTRSCWFATQRHREELIADRSSITSSRIGCS